MNTFSKSFCRIYQGAFRIAMPVLPYREPKLLDDIAQVSDELRTLGINSVLLVTDETLSNSDYFKKFQLSVTKSGINLFVYDKTYANPTVDNVNEAYRIYRNNNCKAIIAYGGGSPIDCAKAVGARVAFPNKTLQQLTGLLKVWRKLPCIIAIPTTAGTGSEVTVTAVITDSRFHHKCTMNNFTMIPRFAVHDPAVTYSLPQHLTATTGIDALTHSIEAYIGRSTSKETRTLSLEATKLIFENIEIAYNDSTNENARKNMLTAAYKAGIAFSKSYVGYIHAVAHSLGGQYNIPHGLANSVLLPVVLEDYGKVIHKKLRQLGIAAGVAALSDSPDIAAQKFINSIKALNNRLGIPTHLKGIKKEDIPAMARFAAKEANPLYPVPKLMNSKELEKYYIKVSEVTYNEYR